MQPQGTVLCFMCGGLVPYNPQDPVKFENHMKTDHSAYLGLDFLLAGCRMSEEERRTVNEVVGEKEVADGATGEVEQIPEIFIPVATLEEGQIEDQDVQSDVVQIKREMFSENSHKCDFCQKSFTLLENLEEHVSRKHPSRRQSITNSRGKSQPRKIGKTSSAVKVPRGFQNKNTKIIDRRRKSAVPRRQSQDIPEGQGFPCQECGKVFRTEAMERFHYTDVHVTGHFPCKGGCGKIFTSKNKMSSHWSRHCNPRNKSRLSI